MADSATMERLPPQKIAAILVGLLFLLSLVSRVITWDWLFDTAYLGGAAFVALRPERPDRFPIVCCYLFLDSALQAVAGLFFPGTLLLVYLLLTGLYGAALRGQLRDRGMEIERLPWRGLFRLPALRITAAVLLPLACLYLPMLHLHHTDMTTTAPLVVTVGQVTTMSSGHAIDLGGEVTYRGIQVGFGRAAALLLAAIAVGHLLRLAGIARASASLRLMRVAAIGVGAWWLVAAQGIRSVDNIYNLVFIAGIAFLMAALFAWAPENHPGDPT